MNYKEILKNKEDIFLIIILLLAFFLRIKYFNINTGIWWDEAEYLVMAKDFAFHPSWVDWSSARPMFLPLIWALFLKIGLGEISIRFFTEFIPSFGLVLLIYLIGTEIYNKKVGLISSFIYSVFWLSLFLTGRLLTEQTSLFFGLLSIYLFWKGYIKKEKNYYIYLSGIFMLVAVLIRFPTGFILLPLVLFLLIKDRLTFLKNKQIWLSVLITGLATIPYLVWNFIKFKSIFPAFQFYVTSEVTSAIHQFSEPAYYIFKYPLTYLNWPLLIFFIVGLIIILIDLTLGFDVIIKQTDKKYNEDLFVLLWILIPIFFFVFIYKYSEERYLLIILPAILFITSKGLLKVYEYIKKYNNIFAILLIFIILIYAGFQQYEQGKDLINVKKDTYLQVKEAALWIKENTPPDTRVHITANQMEFMAYAERKTSNGAGHNESDFYDRMKMFNPDYLIISYWYQKEVAYPDWFIKILQENTERYQPVIAFFVDKEKTQPGAIILKINKQIPEKASSS